MGSWSLPPSRCLGKHVAKLLWRIPLQRTISSILLIIGLIILAYPLPIRAQVPNEGIANMVIQARQRNAAQMKQYFWTSRIELTQNGTTQDTRIDQVSYGPDGNLQQTLQNDQSAPLPGGFLRRAIAENTRKQLEDQPSY